MIKSVKRMFFAVFAIMISSIMFNVTATTIVGRVVDATDKSGLIEATVKLLKATRDSAMVKGVTTDEDGNFWITDVKPGRYVISTSYIGYSPTTKSVTVSSGENQVKVGTLTMNPSTIMLKEATVVGVKTEIKVMQDTVEYNADSYKTQPNAVVEDLLKRLPGVELDSDGKITAQGKEVTKILIDGKEFFSDDTKVGTKNIPVKIVDKVQVVDRKSDLSRLTGVDDGEDETVINLTVKKGMNNGWFGNVEAGYGTDDRYSGKLMLNRFVEGNQYTLIAGGNNINEMAFTNGAGSRFTRYGGANGINTTNNVGINFNIGNDDKFRVGGDVMYSHSDQDTKQKNNKQYLFTDSTSYSNSHSIARDKSHNIVGNFRLRWEMDSSNVFDFRPSFSFNFNKSAKNDSSTTIAGDPQLTPVNKSINKYATNGSNYEFGGELVYNHKFKSHPGRSYSTQLKYQFSNKHEDGTTHTDNQYYLLEDESQIINQIYTNHNWSNMVGTRLTWTEPLGNIANARFLTLSYKMQYKFNNADKMVYDVNTGDGSPASSSLVSSLLGNSQFIDYIKSEYTSMALTNPTLLNTIIQDEVLNEQQNDRFQQALNEQQSNKFRNNFFTQSLQLGFKQVRKSYNLDAGLTLNPAMSESKNLINSAKNIPQRWVWNIAPYARIRFKMSQSRSLSLDYKTKTNQPSMTQLQPVADESNPLRIVIGNPNLNPTFTQRFNLRFSDFNQDSQRSIMAMLNGQFASNSIVSRTSYNGNTGGQTTTYENVNGVWNAFAMGMISMPIGSKKLFYYTTHLFTRYARTVGYNNELLNRCGTFTLSLSPGVSFRNDALDIELRPNYNFQGTQNTVKTNGNLNVHTYGGMLNVNYSLPIGITLSSDCSFSGTQGYSEGYNTNQWLWNASLSYGFLKGKAATVSAKVFDILHQKQSISRTVTANYIQDSEYNSLTRYVMFTFSYRFNTFGGGKIPSASQNGSTERPHHGRPMM